MSDQTTPAEPGLAANDDGAVELPYWRVESSFYVQAPSAAEARKLVAGELNSKPVQHLIGDTVGEADVHDDVEPWDMQG